MSHRKNKHHHAAEVHPTNNTKSTSGTPLKMAVLFGFIGLAAGALASQLNTLWTILPAVLGTLIGYFAGNEVEKTLKK